ncbi:MAG TPA: zinc-binding dehydrogenase [Streptosporangiaceae bacterium]|jgi:NADPH:quinone reductase-like Zn-dependent oxidoreductase|nr:zinc-binding dehydrogenase [Streptosporangiaceae bacterium]
MNGDLPGSAARLAAASRDDPEGPSAWPQPVPPAATMRAVILPEFGPPDVLREETLPTPVPVRGEVLVQVAAVSIGRVLDLAARAGRHPYPGFRFPHVLGSEHAGVIAALGPAVTGWQVGERVAAFPVVTDGTCYYCLRGYDEVCENLQLIGIHRPGAYAQYVAVPAANLSRVPPDISPGQATGLALSGAVAMNQLQRSGFGPGEWVLVQGASSALGSVTASLALHLGAHVILASRSPAKRARLAELGADAVLDTLAADITAQVRALTGGRGADIVIDSLGEPGIWETSLAALAPTGALVSSGAFLGRSVPVDLPRLYLQAQRIIGVRSGNAASITALWTEVDRGFRPVLDTTFPLENAADAHRYLEDGQNVGRVSLDIPQPERTHPCA